MTLQGLGILKLVKNNIFAYFDKFINICLTSPPHIC